MQSSTSHWISCYVEPCLCVCVHTVLHGESNLHPSPPPLSSPPSLSLSPSLLHWCFCLPQWWCHWFSQSQHHSSRQPAEPFWLLHYRALKDLSSFQRSLPPYKQASPGIQLHNTSLEQIKDSLLNRAKSRLFLTYQRKSSRKRIREASARGSSGSWSIESVAESIRGSPL